MTSPFSGPRKGLRARALPRYPVQIIGGNGVSADRASGNVTIALDLAELAELATLTGHDLTATDVAIILEDGTYRKMPIQKLIDVASGLYVPLDGSVEMTGALDMGGFKIADLGTPTLDGDAATKVYVDTVASGQDAADEIGFTPAGNIAATDVQAAIEELDSEKQASDAGITDIAALTPTDGNVIVGDGANWVAETGATARTSLGVSIGSDVQAWDAQLDSLSGASANGVSLVTAASYAAMKALLDLEIGTDVQAWDAQLDSLSAASANGVSLVTAANYAAMRALLNLEPGTDVQAQSSELALLAALTSTAYGRSLLEAADDAALQALANLEPGTDVQAQSAKLQALHDTAWAADKLLRFTGTGALDLIDYVEGTWTPVIAGASTDGTYTYTNQDGSYTRIGNVVVADFRVEVDAVSTPGSGGCRVSGLPVSPASGDRNGGNLVNTSNIAALPSNFGAWCLRAISGSQISVRYFDTSDGDINNADITTIIGAGTNLTGSVTYKV